LLYHSGKNGGDFTLLERPSHADKNDREAEVRCSLAEDKTVLGSGGIARVLQMSSPSSLSLLQDVADKANCENGIRPSGEASGDPERDEGDVAMYQLIDEPTRMAEVQTTESTRFMQCRFPVAHYEWLRYRAFYDRTSMNSIVLDAIDRLRTSSPDVTGALQLRMSAARLGSVKFNVHLPEATYEWLRTKAFNSRGSINQLLIKALGDHRARAEKLAEYAGAGKETR
jgi:hypothetical protein